MEPKAIVDKKAFATSLKKYIDHCRILADRSKSPLYKTKERVKSLEVVSTYLYPALVHPEQHDITEICKRVVTFKNFLSNILPCLSNGSYNSSLDLLNNLYEKAKSIYNPNYES